MIHPTQNKMQKKKLWQAPKYILASSYHRGHNMYEQNIYKCFYDFHQYLSTTTTIHAPIQ